jgi:hypothetical protein
MTWRRWMAGVIVLGVAGFVVFWPRNPDLVQAIPPSESAPAPRPDFGPPKTISAEERRRILENNPEARLADDLNLPGGDIRSDLAIVSSMVAAYRSIYPGKGNPVGDNRDIVETLLGANPNGIIFLWQGNRAINAQGELCDRWGTPFFFHAESGTKMEIRSAGPDRMMRTADDVIVIP